MRSLRPSLALPSALVLQAPAEAAPPASPRRPARNRGTAHRRRVRESAAAVPWCGWSQAKPPRPRKRAGWYFLPPAPGGPAPAPGLPGGPPRPAPPRPRSLAGETRPRDRVRWLVGVWGATRGRPWRARVRGVPWGARRCGDPLTSWSPPCPGVECGAKGRGLRCACLLLSCAPLASLLTSLNHSILVPRKNRHKNTGYIMITLPIDL